MTTLIALAVCIAIGLVIAALAAWALVAASYRAPVTADEVHMVITPDLWHIRLCRHTAKKGPGDPVFMCHGFMSNQWNFAVPPDESMADLLAEEGYDCWLIDLRGTRSSIPAFGRNVNEPTVDDYLFKDIPAAINYIRKVTGHDEVHWVGHSMGGMLLYAYDTVFGPKHLASGTTLGSPIGFDGVRFHRPTILIIARKLSWHLFRCIQRILISLLAAFHPKSNIVPINWKNMNRKIDARALFSAIEVPPPPVIESLALAAEKGVWRIKDEIVDVFENLTNLRVPLFAIFGAGDPFVPVSTINDFFDGIPTKDKRLLVLSKENGHAANYSHVDLVMGSEIRADVVPPIVEWLRAHPIAEPLVSTRRARARNAAPPKKKAAVVKKAPSRKSAFRRRRAR